MEGHILTCTFCKKSESQVRKLVAGPGVYICDACIEIAHKIVSADEPPDLQESRWHRLATRIGILIKTVRSPLRLARVLCQYGF